MQAKPKASGNRTAEILVVGLPGVLLQHELAWTPNLRPLASTHRDVR
jgi:hypothetical protein